MDGFGLLLAAVFISLAGWGIHSGSMPMKVVDIERAKRPVLFWMAVAVYAGMAALSLAIAFNP